MVRRPTWILLGVLAVVALATFAWPAARPAVEDEALPPVEALWDVPSDEIDSVRVVDLASGAVLLARRDADVGWRLQSRGGSPADSGRVEMGVASLDSPGIVQRLAEPEAPESFGLDPAAYRVSLFLGDGSARSVDIGRIDPTGSAYYVRLPGAADVLLVSRYMLDDVLGWLGDLPIAEPTAVPSGTP